MISPHSRTFVFGQLAIVVIASTVWLSHHLQTTTFADGPKTRKDENKSLSQPVAVVELFTSEGCSSCPPADENLRRLASDAAKRNQKVYPLSFHVDYWNRLGWKDPFSQPAFSQRQREYAELLDSHVYTPQMIVNGTTEFVGSDRRLTDQAIKRALALSAKHEVAFAAVGQSDRMRSSYRYQVAGPLSKTGDATDEVLNIAVATDSETVSVARGENGGRKLSHVWVVKNFEVVPLTSAEGTFEIDLSLVKTDHSRIIAFVQSQSTGAITGAAALDL